MRKYVQGVMGEVAAYLEVILSIILGIVLLILTYFVVADLSNLFSSSKTVDDFLHVFLNRMISLAVGVEVIKMLCRQSPSTVIEVLLVGLSRQLIVDHPSTLEFFLGILAVGSLFAIRKYLFTPFDEANNIVVRASQKVKLVNVIARVKIPAKDNETLREFMVRELTKEGKTVAIGACIYLKTIALRIDHMHEDVVTRVEIIKGI